MSTKLINEIFTEVKNQSWKESLEIFFEPVMLLIKVAKLLIIKIHQVLF